MTKGQIPHLTLKNMQRAAYLQQKCADTETDVCAFSVACQSMKWQVGLEIHFNVISGLSIRYCDCWCCWRRHLTAFFCFCLSLWCFFNSQSYISLKGRYVEPHRFDHLFASSASEGTSLYLWVTSCPKITSLRNWFDKPIWPSSFLSCNFEWYFLQQPHNLKLCHLVVCYISREADCG